jgi:hypothetical protein
MIVTQKTGAKRKMHNEELHQLLSLLLLLLLLLLSSSWIQDDTGGGCSTHSVRSELHEKLEYENLKERVILVET